MASQLPLLRAILITVTLRYIVLRKCLHGEWERSKPAKIFSTDLWLWGSLGGRKTKEPRDRQGERWWHERTQWEGLRGTQTSLTSLSPLLTPHKPSAANLVGAHFSAGWWFYETSVSKSVTVCLFPNSCHRTKNNSKLKTGIKNLMKFWFSH